MHKVSEPKIQAFTCGSCMCQQMRTKLSDSSLKYHRFNQHVVLTTRELVFILMESGVHGKALFYEMVIGIKEMPTDCFEP